MASNYENIIARIRPMPLQVLPLPGVMPSGHDIDPGFTPGNLTPEQVAAMNDRAKNPFTFITDQMSGTRPVVVAPAPNAVQQAVAAIPQVRLPASAAVPVVPKPQAVVVEEKPKVAVLPRAMQEWLGPVAYRAGGNPEVAKKLIVSQDGMFGLRLKNSNNDFGSY